MYLLCICLVDIVAHVVVAHVVVVFQHIKVYRQRKYMVVEQDIVDYFLQTSKGIKATAGYFGLSRSYVGALISRYIKKHNLRF